MVMVSRGATSMMKLSNPPLGVPRLGLRLSLAHKGARPGTCKEGQEDRGC